MPPGRGRVLSFGCARSHCRSRARPRAGPGLLPPLQAGTPRAFVVSGSPASTLPAEFLCDHGPAVPCHSSKPALSDRHALRTDYDTSCGNGSLFANLLIKISFCNSSACVHPQIFCTIENMLTNRNAWLFLCNSVVDRAHRYDRPQDENKKSLSSETK